MGRPSRRPRSIVAPLLAVSLVSLVGTTTVVARDPAVRTNADVVLRSTGDDSFIDRPARSVDVRAIGDSTASTPDERVTMAADVGTAFEGLGRDDDPAAYSGTVGVAVGPEHVVQIDGDFTVEYPHPVLLPLISFLGIVLLTITLHLARGLGNLHGLLAKNLLVSTSRTD